MMNLTKKQREEITIAEIEELQTLGYVFRCEDGKAVSFSKEK